MLLVKVRVGISEKGNCPVESVNIAMFLVIFTGILDLEESTIARLFSFWAEIVAESVIKNKISRKCFIN